MIKNKISDGNKAMKECYNLSSLKLIDLRTGQIELKNFFFDTEIIIQWQIVITTL